MKQLHKSYNNLGSWRVVRDPQSEVTRILFDQRRGIITAAVLFVVLSSAALWLSTIESNTGNDRARIAGVWLLSVTGVSVSVGITLYGSVQARRGDLMRYNMRDDVLDLPRCSTSIDKARQRAYFSSEHFTDLRNHFFELNIVIDGERTKFLSSSISNGFRDIVKPLESLGFVVKHQKIKIE